MSKAADRSRRISSPDPPRSSCLRSCLGPMTSAEAGLEWIQSRRFIQKPTKLFSNRSLNHLTQERKIRNRAVIG
ncbi:Hypothetical predicted protein [Podarcis lilfordi]|uniref:Uncharacterized protein n=1 Tax=Podarcis lilfordi TaxID=74358 RepID=A0AA35JZU4_9SAUR|nr:Hypothetical predicted protein [Podarcis lilfordi]